MVERRRIELPTFALRTRRHGVKSNTYDHQNKHKRVGNRGIRGQLWHTDFATAFPPSYRPVDRGDAAEYIDHSREKEMNVLRAIGVVVLGLPLFVAGAILYPFMALTGKRV